MLPINFNFAISNSSASHSTTLNFDISKYLNFSRSSGMRRESFSIASTFAPRSNKTSVSAPSPGPISNTVSPFFICAASATALRYDFECKKCCPSDFFFSTVVTVLVQIDCFAKPLRTFGHYELCGQFVQKLRVRPHVGIAKDGAHHGVGEKQLLLRARQCYVHEPPLLL